MVAGHLSGNSYISLQISTIQSSYKRCCNLVQVWRKKFSGTLTCWDDELAALRNLRNRSDVVIRPADKGGAFVVWEKELYLNETHRQLSDGRFYQRIPEDATKRNQETKKSRSIYHPGHCQKRTPTISNQPNCTTSAKVQILFASKNT